MGPERLRISADCANPRQALGLLSSWAEPLNHEINKRRKLGCQLAFRQIDNMRRKYWRFRVGTQLDQSSRRNILLEHQRALENDPQICESGFAQCLAYAADIKATKYVNHSFGAVGGVKH